jgi:hypothetical protein
MSSAAASPARTSASQEKALASPEQGPVFGTSSLGSLAKYDPDTSLWRTSQLSLLEGSTPFSGRFPRSGMTRNGTLFQLVPLVLRTGGNGSGSSAFVAGMVQKPTHHVPTPTASDHIERRSTSSEVLNFETNKTVSLDRWVRMWPTPTAGDSKSSGSLNTASSKAHAGVSLTDAVRGDGGRGRMYPTPTVQDASNNGGPSQYQRNSLPLNAVAGGSLNPTWVEWLMGFPLGWTVCDASATRSSRRSSKSSGEQ